MAPKISEGLAISKLGMTIFEAFDEWIGPIRLSLPGNRSLDWPAEYIPAVRIQGFLASSLRNAWYLNKTPNFSISNTS